MRKIYCDICGQETKSYRLLSLPYLYGGEVYQSYDEDDGDEICPACALELYNMIRKFKVEKRKRRKVNQNDVCRYEVQRQA